MSLLQVWRREQYRRIRREYTARFREAKLEPLMKHQEEKTTKAKEWWTAELKQLEDQYERKLWGWYE